MRVSQTTVRKRLIAILIVGLAVFLIIAGRLGYVQFVKGEELTQLAMDSWSRVIPFEPKRGEIRDRNDEVLATNVSAPSVLVVPRQIENPEQSAESLAAILDMDKSRLLEQLTKSESRVWIRPEGQKISKEKASEIRNLRLPGVFIAEDSKRHYPHGNYLSHVLGFAGIDNQGLTGLELYYDEELKASKVMYPFSQQLKIVGCQILQMSTRLR